MNAEELEKLHSLKKKGIITEEEFNSQKNSLLNKKKESTFLWLALLLGGLGIHNFYIGQTIRGSIKLLLWALYLAFPIFPVRFLLYALCFWVGLEMDTKKTAAGDNLIPASTTFKVTIYVILGACFCLWLWMNHKV